MAKNQGVAASFAGDCAAHTFGVRSDRWYASLFRPDYVSGEITPGYILLPRSVIEDIHRLNPDMKIIMLLRNPVSRAWSGARLALGRKVMRATDAQILANIDHPSTVIRGDYVNAINNWRGVFGDQVFIGFFDQLVSAPRDLLRAVLRFLDVDSSDEVIPQTVEKEVNSSFKKRELPENLIPHMYATYIDQLRVLEKMLGGPVTKWLAKAEEAVARDKVLVGVITHQAIKACLSLYQKTVKHHRSHEQQYAHNSENRFPIL